MVLPCFSDRSGYEIHMDRSGYEVGSANYKLKLGIDGMTQERDM